MNEKKSIKRMRKLLWIIPIFIIIGVIVAVFMSRNSDIAKLAKTEESEKQAATTSSDGLWEYSIINTNEAKIESYKGSDTDVIVPSTLDGYTVTAFKGDILWNGSMSGGWNNKKIANIIFPNTINNITSTSLLSDGCILESISVDSTNQYYSSEDGVLFNKDKTKIIRYPLKKQGDIYTIPSSVINIEGYAFWKSSLKSIVIPSGMTTIDGNAFAGCENLTNINIPLNITSIESSAFSGCISLNNIQLPTSIETIGTGAFRDCTGFTSIEIPSGVTKIDMGTFSNCTNLTDVKIPSTVTMIYSTAFNECTSLSSISIPASVTYLDSGVFQNCTGLTTIEIPSSITRIKSYLFYNCTNLTNVKIPTTVTDIENSAFSGCSSLTTLEIPKEVTTIGTDVFKDCTNLTLGVYTDSTAHQYAKENKVKYKLLDLQWEYNIINENQVELTKYLGTNTEVIIPDEIDGYTVTSLGEGLFEENKTLTSIQLPSTVTNIGNSAFDGCTNLTSVGDLSNVTTIGAFAFCQCSSLTTIGEIPNVTSIGAAAFNECTSLTSINLTSKITTIENNTFGGCSNLTSVGDLSNVTTIEMYAFSGCSKLASVGNISKVTDIGAFAFGNCSALTRVDLKRTVANIGEIAFKDCTNLTLGVYTDSTAHQYAKTNSINHILLDGVKSVTLTNTPNKTTYKQGDITIDLAGGELAVMYNDDTSATIPMVTVATEETPSITTDGVTTTGFTTTELGIKTITVSYKDVVATPTFNVEVIQKDINYEENTNGPEGTPGITITKPITPGEGEEGNKDVVIPSEIEGKPVTEIGSGAFEKPAEVETIEIPDSVTTIAPDAFTGNEDAIIICNPGSVAEQYAKDHNMSYIYKGKTITGISVLESERPTKTEYLQGKEETLDITGGKITVTYAETVEGTTDGTGTKLTSKVRMTSPGVEATGFDNTTAGPNTITVAFREQNTTFNITITQNTYTITFDPGTNATVNIPTKQVTNGQTYGTLPNATKEGHTFIGWYDQSGNKINENATVNLTANITLYARYEINKYTVTFKNDDGTTIKTINNVEYGSSVRFDGQTPIKNNISSGYEATFNGWTGIENLQNVTSNTIVTATYTVTPIVYTITYENIRNSDISDKTKFPTSYTVENLKITLRDLANQEQMIFKGWYDENGSKITTIDMSRLGNITLYARWEQVQQQEKLWLRSHVYKIGENDIDNYEHGDVYIEKIIPETTVAEFIADCESNGEITVINQDEKILEEDDIIGTNMTIKVTKDNEEITLIAVVMGDLDGNGLVTVTDLSGINQTVLKVIKLEGALFKAADLDDNNDITVTDLSGINQKILKVIEFSYAKELL